MRPFPFQSIKRALHTSTARARPAKRIPLVAAGSALAFSGYLAWRVSSQPVYMDSSPDISPKLRTIPEKVQEPSSSRLIEENNTETNEIVQPGPTDPSLETQEGSEEEASQAAFNPVTGEINWDCPCLGGMAHGPCGPQFREAFSCFVYSEEEPKGINCVEKFKGMQDCFRLHPEVYGEEILEEDSDEEPSDLNEAPASLNTEESITPSSAS